MKKKKILGGSTTTGNRTLKPAAARGNKRVFGNMPSGTSGKPLRKVLNDRYPAQALLSAIGDGISILSTDFRILYQNAVHKNLIGDHAGEFCYRAYEKRETVCDGCPVKLAFRDGRPHTTERSADTVYGTIHVEITASLLRDSKGNIFAGIEVVRDKSENKRKEIALLESEERFRGVFDNAGVGVSIVDLNGRFLKVNRKLCEILGYTESELLTKSFSDVTHPDDVRIGNDALAKQKEGLADFLSFEKRYLHRDGRVVTVIISPSLVRDASGKPVCCVGTWQDITQRKLFEEALKETNLRLQSLIQTIPDMVMFKDTAGRHVIVNRAVEEVTGHGKEEIVGKTVEELLPPGPAALCRKSDEEAMNQRGPSHSEERIFRTDGTERYLDTLKAPLFDDRNNIIGLIAVSRDITDRKRFEEALTRSRDLLAKAEEIARLGSWEWDISTNRLEWSDEVYRLYGLERGKDALTYDVVINTMHPDFRDRFTMDIESALMRGHPFDSEYCLVRPDGSHRFTHSKGEVIRDSSGNPVRMVGVVQDITDQKQAELMVRNVLETVDEGFIIIGRDYRILSANRAYAQQTGRSVEEIIGKKCHEVSHGHSRPCYDFGEVCAVRQVFDTGEPHSALHTHHNEERDPIYVETKAFPMRDAAGRVTAAIEIVNNITEKRKLEDQLRHAQKMEAVGLLAGGVAHDFNNILTAIIGYGNLLEMRYSEDDPHRQYVHQILAAAARAANLTQSLLAFSRKQVINPRPVDLNDIITRIEKLLRRVIGEDVDLRTTLTPVPLIVMGDAGQMEQILMNLATNARDAMPEGGVLTINTGTATIGQDFRKEHGFGDVGDYAMVTVSDTGTGMDEQTRSRIFEPFFTTKELGRGTGLGLAIVYGAIKQNKGYVTVSSEPGSGTCFTLYLPLIDSAAVKEPSPRQIGMDQRGTGTILVAEDDPTLRNLLRLMLREFGYAVIEAVDGDDAIDKFSQHRGLVDLLVLDVIMPRKNGRETYESIRKMRPGIKTVFISGYSNDVINRDLLHNNNCRYLAKPISPAALLDMIKELLAPAVP